MAGTRAFLILKHVLGYAAGVRKEKEESQTVGWSETRLLDELRSDLVALYYSGDAKLRNLGLVPEEECGVAILEAYTSGLIEGTATDGVFSNRSKAQKRAQQIVVRYAIEKGAAEVVAQDGHFFARMIDHSAMREAVAELLATVLKMSATGEIGSLQKLIDAYGHPLPSTWRKDAVARYEKLGLPRHLAFVLPRFGVKKNAKGEVKDFVLSSRDNLIQGLMDGYDLKQ